MEQSLLFLTRYVCLLTIIRLIIVSWHWLLHIWLFLISTMYVCNDLCSQVMQHTGLLEHWFLWQAADFCVAHRLRTPIGKPLDTFMCIEAAIKQISADNRIEVSPKCGGIINHSILVCACVYLNRSCLLLAI